MNLDFWSNIQGSFTTMYLSHKGRSCAFWHLLSEISWLCIVKSLATKTKAKELHICGTYISSPSTVFMQYESITLTTFQVSFCKFKFTGGLKPTLEEKKFLHIDSCGNFCYKSGSGDKAFKRLEYFQKDVIPTNSKIASEAFNSLSQSTCKLDYNLSTSSHFNESTNRYVVTQAHACMSDIGPGHILNLQGGWTYIHAFHSSNQSFGTFLTLKILNLHPELNLHPWLIHQCACVYMNM